MKLFRTAVLGLALAGCVTSAGCGAGQLFTPPTSVADVQADAVKVCSYLPSAETIVAIIGLNDPTLSTATAIADAICGAITSRSARAGGVPRVKGVRIKGQFR